MKKVKAKSKKATSKKPLKSVPSKKQQPTKDRFKKMASKIGKSTKKMVDEVLLKLIGNRVLERAQVVSADLKKEKTQTRKVRRTP